MGCASSTPMVATAGSDILKAATHVADDVKSKAEDTVKEVTTTLEETLDTSKNAVSTAITGITTELGQVFQNQTKAIDDTKNELMEKLHLSDAAPAATKVEHLNSTEAAAAASEAVKTLEENLEPRTEDSHTLNAEDMDSLRTSTPEPEIEQALSNNDDEESPPTPKPTLAEFANLTAEGSDGLASSETPMERLTGSEAAQNNTSSHTPTAPLAMEPAWNHEVDLKRPNTTEWEKFADMLAHNRKFKPYEAFSRNINQFSIYQDYTRVGERPDLQYDGSFSDASPNTLTSLSQSSLTSPQFKRAIIMPPAAVIVDNIGGEIQKVKRIPSDFASLMACEQPGGISQQTNHNNNTIIGRQFDYNPNRDRITLQTADASSPSTLSQIGSTNLPETIGDGHVVLADSMPNGKSTWKRQHINSIGSSGIQTPQSQILPNKLVPITRISQSSSSSTGTDGVVIMSNLTTPSTLSPVRTSLPSLGKCSEEEEVDDVANRTEAPTNDSIVSSTTPVLIRRSRTPTRRVSNTSSFLSSPRVSPFSGRKDYSTGGNKENKPVTFIPAFSSVTPSKTQIVPSPSPYRIRERCEVCYNKYVIK